jgi:hypothetical protein
MAQCKVKLSAMSRKVEIIGGPSGAAGAWKRSFGVGVVRCVSIDLARSW